MLLHCYEVITMCHCCVSPFVTYLEAIRVIADKNFIDFIIITFHSIHSFMLFPIVLLSRLIKVCRKHTHTHISLKRYSSYTFSSK